MTAPKISIILPVYNGAAYLAEAIESVVSQDFADWELIVVNDGSTDSSSDIARSFTDSRITVVDTENGGLSVARNRGIARARGEWLSFIDADDALHCRALSALLSITGDDIDLAVGGFSVKPSALKRPLSGRVRTLDAADLLEETLFQRGAVHAAWGKLYRRELFDHELFTPGLLYEDLDFFYRCCRHVRKAAVTSARLYFYRQTPGSIVHTWSDRRCHVLRITAEIESCMAVSAPTLLPAARDRRFSANFNILLLAAAHGRTDIAAECYATVKQLRLGSLMHPRVRIKNKAGAAASYLGFNFLKLLSQWAGK